MQVDNYVSDRNRKRRKRRIYFYAAAAAFAVYFLALGVFWLIFRSPIFSVDRVVVQGNAAVPNDAVVSLMQSSALRGSHGFFDALLGFHNILMWPDELSSSDLMLVPALANVQISKDYFDHTITATVAERQPFGTWCLESGANAGDCYLFDDTGTIFRRVLNTEGGSLVTVQDDSQTKLGLNETVLPAGFVPNFISIVNALRATGLGVSGIILKDLSLEEVDVSTVNGPNVLFSLRFPADNDVQVIESIMQQSNFAKLQYVDCRTENRVYYK